MPGDIGTSVAAAIMPRARATGPQVTMPVRAEEEAFTCVRSIYARAGPELRGGLERREPDLPPAVASAQHPGAQRHGLGERSASGLAGTRARIGHATCASHGRDVPRRSLGCPDLPCVVTRKALGDRSKVGAPTWPRLLGPRA